MSKTSSQSIASELTFTTRGNNFYSLSIPFTLSTVIKGIAFSIFNFFNDEASFRHVGVSQIDLLAVLKLKRTVSREAWGPQPFQL